MNRIICIGNPIFSMDRAGSEVFLKLKQKKLPDDLELIDGGLDGLKLLRLVDGCEKVVFVDNVSGFGSPNQVMVLHDTDISKLAEPHFEHLSGLPYLLKMLPVVCEINMPAIRIIGIESPHQSSAVDQAACLALDLFNQENDRFWADRELSSEVCR